MITYFGWKAAIVAYAIKGVLRHTGRKVLATGKSVLEEAGKEMDPKGKVALDTAFEKISNYLK